MKHVLSAVVLVLAAAAASAATFTVTNNNDSGPGSLRDAVAQANATPAADTINFAVTGTIVLTSGQLAINAPVDIIGPGAAVLTIDGNANSRIFSVFENVPDVCATPGTDFPVVVSGLTLTNGRRTADSPGGAMYSEKSLLLDGVVISNSEAKAGGGLAVLTRYAAQTLTISNTQFIGNSARPFMASTPGIYGTSGGGLAVAERCFNATAGVTVQITSSQFVGNRTRPVTFGSAGAGIWMWTSAAILITDTRVVANTIVTQNPAVMGQNNRGGGISIQAGAANPGIPPFVQLLRTEVSANFAERAAGIRLLNDNPELQEPTTVFDARIINSTIGGNVGTTPGIGVGGIGTYGNVSLLIDNSTVGGNVSPAGAVAGVRITTGPTNPVSGANAAMGTLTLASTIVANDLPGSPDIGFDELQVGSFTFDATASLFGPLQAGVTVIGTGNIEGPSPKLGPLMFNGGPTRTMQLLPGSPAINAGSNPRVLTTDQRGPGFARVVGGAIDIGAFESGNPLPATGFAAGSTFVTSSANAAPAGIASLAVACPASGLLVVSASGESAAKSNFAGTAFIGLAYSIARDSGVTDNANVVQSSALAKFSGDANRDFLNVQRIDPCTPGQSHTYFLTAYATTPQTSTANGSFVWNGRLTASGGPATSGFAPSTTYVTSAANATPTIVTSLNATCPASGLLSVSGSGESAAVSNAAGSAFIGLAYSIARNSTATDNGNVVQSSALAVFNGDANRDFLNVQRLDACTPGQSNTYNLTVYATSPQTSLANASFVWNGRLVANEVPVVTSFAAGSTVITSASNATPTVITSLNVTCPASGTVVVGGSGESAAVSNAAGNAFIGIAYSIARGSTATDNGNVVQSSALSVFNGDANRDFLNVQRADTCTPGQAIVYNLTAYATTPQTSTASSFLWNGRLVATLP